MSELKVGDRKAMILPAMSLIATGSVGHHHEILRLSVGRGQESCSAKARTILYQILPKSSVSESSSSKTSTDSYVVRD